MTAFQPDRHATQPATAPDPAASYGSVPIVVGGSVPIVVGVVEATDTDSGPSTLPDEPRTPTRDPSRVSELGACPEVVGDGALSLHAPKMSRSTMPSASRFIEDIPSTP